MQKEINMVGLRSENGSRVAIGKVDENFLLQFERQLEPNEQEPIVTATTEVKEGIVATQIALSPEGLKRLGELINGVMYHPEVLDM